jgi:glycopeptide antibiotics resistance protein
MPWSMKEHEKSYGKTMWRKVLILKKQKVVCSIVFSIYIFIVLYLTIFRFNFYYQERQLNLSLFTDLINVFRNVGVGEFFRLFLGNIGWFVPFGFLLPMLLKRKNLLITMAIGMVFSLFIETMQFILRNGVAELDDLILNTVGTAFGYLLYKLSQKTFLK